MVGFLIAAVKGLVLVPQVTYMQAIIAFVSSPKTVLQGNVAANPAVHSDPFTSVNAWWEILRNLNSARHSDTEDPVVRVLCSLSGKVKCRHLGSKQ